MSKKIIYLLSLLMALSLVFASCKKSNPTDALGGGNQPPSEESNDGNSKENGLYDDSSSMPTDDVIRRDTIFNGTLNGNYHRNPVIVAGRDGAVFIFFEIRYERAGAVNDVGIDGKGKVDIAYVVSANAGKDKFGNSTIKYVNNGGSATTTIQQSHGAPIVYYIKDSGNEANKDKVVIVASAGSGFGRTTQEILNSTPSKVEYIIGTFTSNTEISWGSWKTITDPNITETVKTIKVGSEYGSDTMLQFGTHSHRGVITTGNKLILPLVVANQGTTDPGPEKELMGVYVLKGTVNTSDISWEATGVGVGYNGDTGSVANFGQWKASEAIATKTDGSTYKVLTVPSPVGRANNFTLGEHTSDGNVTPISGVNASEGSFGYLLTDKWYGSESYTVGNSLATKSTMVLYSHVKQREANLSLYLLDQNMGSPKSFQLGGSGKSSSIDMLPDGTIILAAENTKDGDGYFMQFERRTQAKIAELAK